MGTAKKPAPWYSGEHQDALLYLMIAIFFLELIIGGIAFFYGIMHAEPEIAGGPPVARFPWLFWVFAAVFGPVALLLIVHLAGTWVNGVLTREENPQNADAASGSGRQEEIPAPMKRFYAAVRHAPTVVILTGLLLIGAGLFFVDGALALLASVGTALIPYIPWIAGSAAALLGVCFLAHAILVYRQRKMENEYAWRREVLAKTGLVLLDKKSSVLAKDPQQMALITSQTEILDVSPMSLGPAEQDAPAEDDSQNPAGNESIPGAK